jgi:transmembrane sensor
MSARPSNSHDAIAAQAATWVARCDAGLSHAEASELAAWRAADPRHVAAFDQLQQIWSAADRPRAAGAAAKMHAQLAARAQRRRKRRLAAAAAALVVCLAGAFSMREFTRGPAVEPAARTAVAQTTLLGPERRTLPDGSTAEYPRGTILSVDFSGDARRISFDRGEAHFEVAHDPARPFIVSAGGIAVRAVGTAFAVHVSPESTAVLVTEGKVAVNAASPSVGRERVAPTLIEAGQTIAVPATPLAGGADVILLTGPEMEARLAWRQRRAEFSAVPLAEVIATVNRHNAAQFVIEDEALRAVPLSGVFRIDHAEEFAQLLETGFGLAIERVSATRFAVKARR